MSVSVRKYSTRGYSDRACVRHSKSTVEERGIGRSEKGTEGSEVVCEGWAPGDVS